jgi:hypothetical protein
MMRRVEEMEEFIYILQVSHKVKELNLFLTGYRVARPREQLDLGKQAFNHKTYSYVWLYR